MKLVISYLALAAILIACEGKRSTVPPDLIPQEKFVDVLFDVRLLEGAYSTKVSKPDTIKMKMEAYYQSLFDKHGISKLQFITSEEYYMKNSNLLLSIEDSVMEKLNSLNTTQNEFKGDDKMNLLDSLGYKKEEDSTASADRKSLLKQ